MHCEEFNYSLNFDNNFVLQVNNDPECLSSPYSCKRSVSLFFSGDEQIKMSSEVTYKGFG